MPTDEISSLASSFDSYAERLPGTVGLAYVPVGGERVVALGEWRGGVAWSTSKVPVAIAALRAAPDAAKDHVTAAITWSDNAASEELWSLLGAPADAGAAVEAVLREAGDHRTRVQSRRVRPEFTAFGQTEWSLAQQALFTAHLPHIATGSDVLALMRALVPEHHWGLARFPGAATKAGWGPDARGAHMVRQLGVIPNGDGWTAVTVGADPESGGFEEGIALLDRLYEWVQGHLGQLPAGR
ncbi:hypothetical protein IU500_06540 [Nocardia terpenica]|uniref:serine hydrolase n=1 Tax=Nocardia terpenica TaxID=455432 RepID=UPI001895AAE3|nr:serine hydrolase [Nocardia terpenica]MBF6060437.1 hypothetical protein [Nocardia terpenica]MBF6103697.1 hypothetical protein [Nocardia terpenica]MBF6111929.1 hypothetical protein [Nocardia terpenica]MBF6117918.1 hypothetical protein [Nocardia terpenica]MBF6155356.1 hypothetical protein [Nocardia terpenica]